MLYQDASAGQTTSAYGGPSAAPAPDAPQVGTASAPAPAPAPAAPAGSVTIPGYTPDWSGLITKDPAYMSAQANAAKAKGDAAAQRKSTLQQAIIKYGGLPPGFSDQYGDVGQDTLDAAGQNQYSTLSQLARNYSQNEEQFKRGLAARGALQSGDLNYGEDQLQNAYGQQRYDAANAVGSEINQALTGYTNVLGQNARDLTSGLQGAEQSVQSNPGYAPTQASSANYDASNSTTYGQPIYVDSAGNLFDQNGNPFTPSGAASGAAAPSAPAPDAQGGDIYYQPSTGAQQAYRPAYGLRAL